MSGVNIHYWVLNKLLNCLCPYLIRNSLCRPILPEILALFFNGALLDRHDVRMDTRTRGWERAGLTGSSRNDSRIRFTLTIRDIGTRPTVHTRDNQGTRRTRRSLPDSGWRWLTQSRLTLTTWILALQSADGRSTSICDHFTVFEFTQQAPLDAQTAVLSYDTHQATSNRWFRFLQLSPIFGSSHVQEAMVTTIISVTRHLHVFLPPSA